MINRIKLFYYNHKTWFYNLEYIFLSFILMIVVTLIDLRIIPIQEYLPDIITMDISLSRSILTTLAGSLLTITTFTFSTILVILNMYASSFTPRVVENFVNRKITMKVLGIYIGGFFYCITTLLVMQDFFEYQHLISGTVAIVYSIICIIYFVRFVQAVISNFQGVNLVYSISEEAKKVIANEVEERTTSPEDKVQEYGNILLKSSDSGYLGMMDAERMLDLLKDKKGVIDVKVKIGEYVSEETVLARIHLPNERLEEEDLERFNACFILQDKKISTSNYRYNLTKLLEIALRALSPGINDPNTAIHCINKIGVLLLPLAKTDLYHIQRAALEGAEVFYSSYSFGEDLEHLYVPLIEYGKTDLSVIKGIIKSFYILYESSTAKNKALICELVEHIEQKISPLLVTDLEKKIFYQELKLFDQKTEECEMA
ncbi:MAG: DUF2254 family protein [Peptostreptococcaceae bacterium]|nr:DUF2254 family protein [Peptostreptococcaceae bacterium]